jgi:hypothetical protein
MRVYRHMHEIAHYAERQTSSELRNWLEWVVIFRSGCCTDLATVGEDEDDDRWQRGKNFDWLCT